MVQEDDAVVTFVLNKPMKTAKTGEPLQTISLKSYDKVPKLCVVRTLKEYLKRTKPIRGSPMLFLSYKKPHTNVPRDTVSRWVMSVMNQSGIDTGVYKSHSTRGAGVSAGVRLGISTNVLLKYGSWKGEKTMAKHYAKKVEDAPEVDLGQAPLDEFA